MTETRGQLPEVTAQEQLVAAYIHNEQSLLAQVGLPLTKQAIEDQERILSEVSEASIFSAFSVDGGKKAEMRQIALKASEDFWMEKLTDPNLSANAVAFGQNRKAEITQRLEELAKPPENPT